MEIYLYTLNIFHLGQEQCSQNILLLLKTIEKVFYLPESNKLSIKEKYIHVTQQIET